MKIPLHTVATVSLFLLFLSATFVMTPWECGLVLKDSWTQRVNVYSFLAVPGLSLLVACIVLKRGVRASILMRKSVLYCLSGWLIFLMASIASWNNSTFGGRGGYLKGAIAITAIGTISTLAMPLILDNERLRMGLRRAVSAWGIFICVVTIAQFLLAMRGIMICGLANEHERFAFSNLLPSALRAVGTADDPGTNGMLLLFSLSLQYTLKLRKIVGTSLLHLIALIATGSRSALIAATVLLVYVGYKSLADASRTKKIIATVAILVSASLLTMFMVVFRSSAEGSNAERRFILEFYFNHLTKLNLDEVPGFYSLASVMEAKYGVTHFAHNIFLDLFSWYGALFGLALSVWLLYPAVHLFKRRLFLPQVITFLITIQFVTPLTHYMFGIFISFCYAYLGYEMRKPTGNVKFGT